MNDSVDQTFEEADELKVQTLMKDGYMLEIFLSTDGKHTVHAKAITAQGKKDAWTAASALYDRILERYGTKQGQAVKEYQRNGEDKDEAGYCKIHKVWMKKYEKNGRSWYAHMNGDEWCNAKEK